MRIAPLVRLGIPHSGITRTGDTADGYRVVTVGRLAHAHNPLSLLELALVVVVIAIAGAVAVPEFTAKTRLTQATRSLEQHHAATGTFAGAAIPGGVRLRTAGRGSFCVEAKAGDNVWHAAQNSKLAPGACPR